MAQPAGRDAATKLATEAAEGSLSHENLALLYQGLLTGIVRMQTRRQHISDGESFRRRTKTVLQEVEREAIASGYDGNDVRETHFAVVAFLDSVVLNSDDPVRGEWERRTLQEELFGQTDAGVVFFEKLQHFRSRRDSQHLADILEVYLLCLLLGFEGRYAGGLRGDLDVLVEKLRLRIDDIRGTVSRISPMGVLPPNSKTEAPHETPRAIPYRMIAVSMVIATLLCFLVLKLQLIWSADQVRSKLF